MQCALGHANLPLQQAGHGDPAVNYVREQDMRFTWLVALGAFALVAQAQAQTDIKPAVVYDVGTKFDKSFNEAAYNGAKRFSEENGGMEFREFEIQTDEQRQQVLETFAREGNNPIVAVGFLFQPSLEAVAPKYPDTQFVTIDFVVDLPNVHSITFKEDEGSYLVGILAAMASDAKKVGFVGGMDIGLIRKFACGYVQGVKSVDPNIEVLQAMTGTTGAAFNDPVKGAELAKTQFDQGADVVYHAAGGTGIGVLQAAADAGKLGIGVDSNQNQLHPGSVLTSMLKRVDNAVYGAFTDAMAGTLEGGQSSLGLAEEGVGWALDEHNKELITPEMQAAVDKAEADIASGAVTVHDYMSDNSCPVS